MPARIQVRRHRRGTVGKYRIKQEVWQDPYPWIDGTEPEKRIFEQLVKLGIYFIFQGQIPEYEKGGTFHFLSPPVYKPDFVIPDRKVILDPFGPFAHSGNDSSLRDTLKIADYNILGYAYYHMWALPKGMFQWTMGDEIVNTDPLNASAYRIAAGPRSRIVSTLEMLMEIPELVAGPTFPIPESELPYVSQGYRIGEFLGAGANSVAAANHKRKKMKSLGLRVSSRR